MMAGCLGGALLLPCHIAAARGWPLTSAPASHAAQEAGPSKAAKQQGGAAAVEGGGGVKELAESLKKKMNTGGWTGGGWMALWDSPFG